MAWRRAQQRAPEPPAQLHIPWLQRMLRARPVGNPTSAVTAALLQEVTIRRRPPHGVEAQNCGPVDFKVPLGGEQQLFVCNCLFCCIAAEPAWVDPRRVLQCTHMRWLVSTPCCPWSGVCRARAARWTGFGC